MGKEKNVLGKRNAALVSLDFILEELSVKKEEEDK